MVNAVEAEPLFLAFDGLRLDDAMWREHFTSALAGPTLHAAHPPELYCETNASTEIIINLVKASRTPQNATRTPSPCYSYTLT